MIWIEGVRDATPEEIKNQLHYETKMEESQDDIARVRRTVQRFI